MGTWSAIFINTASIESVTNKLKELSGIDALQRGAFPTADLYNNILLEDNAKPTYLVYAQTQTDWIMVRHNSLRGLEKWGVNLSNDLSVKVIICSAQTTADFYHFSLYYL